MAYTISQNLNIRPKYFPHVVVHVSAGDANIPVHFSIYDGASTYTIPSGTTITVHGYRKDGGNWITNGTYSGNVVSFTLPRAAMAIEGAGIADVVFTTGNEVVGSANFCLLVERATFPNGVAYSNDSSVFQDLLNFVNSSAVPEAISDWLEENITATSPAVDASLTVQGAAADAKATGDALINKSVTQASLSGNVVSFKNANNSEKFTLDLSDLDDIKTVTNMNQMTDTNSIYKYTGTEAGKQKGLYYYSALSSSWVLIGSEIQSVSLMSRMTDTNSLYKYTGTETGKQKGIYYHNGTEWEFLGGGVQTGMIEDMTNTKMLYRYTGTNPKMIPNALYYYNGTEWVPVGKLPSTEAMETVTVVPRWEKGAIGTNGGVVSSTTRTTHNEYIEVKAGAVISVESEDEVKFGVAIYTESKAFLEIVKNITDSALTYTVTKDCLIRVWAGYDDDSTLADNFAVAELGAKVSITTPTAIKFQPTTVGMETGHFSTESGLNNQDKTYLYQRSQKVINVHGQKVIKVKFPSEIIQTVDTIWVFSYNKNKTPLSSGSGRLYRIKSKELEQVLILPDNAYYIRVFAAWESAHYNVEPLTVSAAIIPTEEYLFANTSTFYSDKINYPVSGNNITGGTLSLPPNYTSDGKSVPLIVCAGGSDWYPEFDSALSGSARPIWEYFRNEGFAVFDCYAWTQKYGTGNTYSPYITPVNLLCYLKGIEYVCSRYNVDINRVFLCCISQGGEFGLWTLMQETTNIKAVSFLSTGNNICKFSSGGIFVGKTGRTAMNKVMHLDGTQEEIEAFINTDAGWQDSDILAFCRRNLNQFVATVPWAQGISGTDADEIFDLSLSKLTAVPQWMVDKGVPSTFVEPPAAFVAHEDFAKYAHVPSKFWGSFDDNAVCMHNNYAIYQWLMNGGSDTEFRQLPDGTGGHYSAIGFNNTAGLKSSGTTALGIAYTDVPTALVETVAFFHDKLCDL